MHIILSGQNAAHLREKYIVLELDQIRLKPNTDPVSAFCVLEDIPIDELPLLDSHINLHNKLIENYRNKNWDFCEQAIEHLQYKWNKQLESFYLEIASRIAKYRQQDPGKDWDPAINKF